MPKKNGRYYEYETNSNTNENIKTYNIKKGNKNKQQAQETQPAAPLPPGQVQESNNNFFYRHGKALIIITILLAAILVVLVLFIPDPPPPEVNETNMVHNSVIEQNTDSVSHIIQKTDEENCNDRCSICDYDNNKCLLCKSGFDLFEGKCIKYAFYAIYHVDYYSELVQLFNPNKSNLIYAMKIVNNITIK